MACFTLDETRCRITLLLVRLVARRSYQSNVQGRTRLAFKDEFWAPCALPDEKHLTGCRIVCIHKHASTAYVFDSVRPGTKAFYREPMIRREAISTNSIQPCSRQLGSYGKLWSQGLTRGALHCSSSHWSQTNGTGIRSGFCLQRNSLRLKIEPSPVKSRQITNPRTR